MKQTKIDAMITALPAKRTYTSIPASLLKARRKKLNTRKRYTLSAIAVGGEIYGFTCDKAAEEQPICTRTYASFSQRLGISPASVNRSLGALEAGGSIERKSRSEYITTMNKEPEYLRLENWVNTAEFDIGRKSRRLTLAERLIFALIFTRCDNGKGGGNKYCASNKDIAAVFGINVKTVSKAINTLISARLIVRAEYERGVNFTHKSIYHINKRLLSRNRVATTNEDKKAQATEDRSERERWYAQRKQDAEERAECNERKARTDNRFKAADTELRTLASKEAYAELHGELTELMQIQARRRELEAERIKALRRLNLTPDDLVPHYNCSICNDTGYTPQGRPCSCYGKKFMKN